MTGEQGELLPRPVGPVGMMQAAAREAVALAKLDPRHLHGGVLLVQVAAAIDKAFAAGPRQLYAGEKLVERYLAVCAQFGFDPAGGGDPADDAWNSLMQNLANDGAGPAARDSAV